MCSFVDGFLSQIKNRVDDETLEYISRKLTVYCADFDITEQCRELTTERDLFPELCEYFIIRKKINGLSDKTLKLYQDHLKKFFARTLKKVEDITKDDIERYKAERLFKDYISESTVNNEVASLKSFFSWASSEGYIDRNPAASVDSVKCAKKDPEHLTPMEMELLRKACATLREKAIVEFFYSTGCRVSAALRVKIQDIDFASGEARVFEKGKKYNTVYLSDRCIIALKDYLRSRYDDHDALFVSDRKPHNPLATPKAIELIFEDLGERAGIAKHVHPHLIRHTTATHGLANGMQIEQVQRMLGHSTIATTLIYAEVADDGVKKAHKKAIV